MGIPTPTTQDIIAYREANDLGLDEAKRALWKRWRLATIAALRARQRGRDEHNHELDEDAADLLDLLESIEGALQ